MKGITTILEATLAGTIIVMLFLYFFPQYQSKNEWGDLLLQTTVQDTLNIIDLTGKTYNFATNDNSFEQFMKNMFSSNSAYVWWKDIDNLPSGKDTKVLYFTKAKKATVLDVVYENGQFKVYSFTLYLGYVF
ncbi:MAG: hypothetical protein KQA41_03150 [Candidatus Aenigmarchaeota archaeon]|nr:hypothetical protein [Candidatus Aenigmarchaeota archaeon]MBU5689197.1 hypothetical protein [Candidatus Aenigmarchaeota archaeon]